MLLGVWPACFEPSTGPGTESMLWKTAWGDYMMRCTEKRVAAALIRGGRALRSRR